MMLEQQPDQPVQLEQPAANLLRRYLPPSLADALQHAPEDEQVHGAVCEHLATTHYALSTYLPHRLVAHHLVADDHQPWLEWIDGTLLFADVSGSTALAERLTTLGREGAEIVTDTLNAYFDRVVALVQAAGGDVLTFGGDALLVLFSDGQHAHTATATARALLDDALLSRFERRVADVGTFALRMHLGVESGRVALVSAGMPTARRYSVLGYTVNGVAQAECLGARDELVVGPRAWAAIAEAAVGEEVKAGFVRVQRLSTPVPTNQRLPAQRLLAATMTSAQLAEQVDRISAYLPTNVLDRVIAQPHLPQIEAELRTVTVLFAQVEGLSAVIETCDPAAAVAFVDQFIRMVQQAVQQFGGVINKLDLAEDGDKLLVVFGAPVAYEDHAERAARAALALHAVFTHSWQVEHNLRLRIGLNTGNVFAGNVGTATRKEYTVMGDAVNVASRVMTKTPWGEIWCSAAVIERVGLRLASADRGDVVVKGKPAPLRLFGLLGERRDTATTAVAVTPLVGRQPELAVLREQLTSVQAGGRVVRLSGEAGVGKSRLTHALCAEARKRGVQTLVVQCFSYKTSTPYEPWSDLLKGLCAIEPGDDEATRRSKLDKALGALADGRTWLPVLGELVGLTDVDDALLRVLDPQQRQARRFALITELVGHAARQAAHGMLVVFEDLHWADSVSLNLWQHIATKISECPMLLLGVHRPQSAWVTDTALADQALLLVLGELSVDDCVQLLQSRAGPEQIDAALQQQLVERAAGNPMFLEELLRTVQANRPSVASAQLTALPDSLSDLLLARIDALDEQSRTLLRVASVVGQRFPIGVLQSIHPDDQRTLIQQLGNLDAQELTVMERAVPERVHTFRHALLQEVAYNSLLYARRRELHRQIGFYLEERYRDEIAAIRQQYGVSSADAPIVQIGRNGALTRQSARVRSGPIFLVAHHYRLSDNHDHAATCLLLAGHAARDDYANDQAIQYYRWAIDALANRPNDPRTWEAREALGDVLCTIGEYDAAQEQYALLMTHGALPPAVAAEVVRSWGDALEKQGQFVQAIDKLRQAEAIAQAHLDNVPPLLLAAIYTDMGLVLTRLGDYDEALRICECGLSMLRDDQDSVEDERIEADLQRQIGTIYAMRGDYPKARHHFESALTAQEAISDLFGASRSHNNIGYLWQLQSNYRQAIAHYAKAETLARRLSAKYLLTGAYLNSAYAHCRLGHYDEAAYKCDAALDHCQEMSDQLGIAQIQDTKGLIFYNRGDYSAATDEFNRALQTYREQSNEYQEGNTLANLATVHTALGDTTTALDYAKRAKTIAEQNDLPHLQLEAQNAFVEAQLLVARQNYSHEEQVEVLTINAILIAQAVEQAESLGSKLDYGIARRLQGQIAAQQRLPFAEHFEASMVLFDEIESRFEQARTAARYSEALQSSDPIAAAAYRKQALDTFTLIEAQGELARLQANQERSI